MATAEQLRQEINVSPFTDDMKAEGMSSSVISRITGLSEDAVGAL